MELALGQYNREGAATVWKICPVFKGKCPSPHLNSTVRVPHTCDHKQSKGLSSFDRQHDICWPFPSPWSQKSLCYHRWSTKWEKPQKSSSGWLLLRSATEEEFSPVLPFPSVLGSEMNWVSLGGGRGWQCKHLEITNPIQVSSALSPPATNTTTDSIQFIVQSFLCRSQRTTVARTLKWSCKDCSSATRLITSHELSVALYLSFPTYEMGAMILIDLVKWFSNLAMKSTY